MPRFIKALLIVGAAAVAVAAISVSYYVVLPVLSPYSSVEIPPSCSDGAPAPGPVLPAARRYAVPNVGTGLLMTSDARSALVVVADYSRPPFSSAAFLIRKDTGRVVRQLRFENDIVAGAIDGGVLYLFNDKLGYMIDARTGRPSKNLIETDNYRGFYSAAGRRYRQTSLEISALRLDGPPVAHLRLSLHGLAFGCVLG
jgi:hypothetical protein